MSAENMSTQPLTLLACDWPVQTEAIIKFSVRHKTETLSSGIVTAHSSKALHYVKCNLLGRTEYLLYLPIDFFPLHSRINPDLPMRRGGGRGGGRVKTPRGYLGQFLLGMCHWPLQTPTPL